MRGEGRKEGRYRGRKGGREEGRKKDLEVVMKIFLQRDRESQGRQNCRGHLLAMRWGHVWECIVQERDVGHDSLLIWLLHTDIWR